MRTNYLVNLLTGVTLIEMIVAIGLKVNAIAVGHPRTFYYLASNEDHILLQFAALGLLLLPPVPHIGTAGALVGAACPPAYSLALAVLAERQAEPDSLPFGTVEENIWP